VMLTAFSSNHCTRTAENLSDKMISRDMGDPFLSSR
jgi:hypothetical protein